MAALILCLGLRATALAATTIFDANIDNASAGAVTTVSGLGTPAAGTWSFVGAAQGGISTDASDKAALFAKNTTTAIPWVTSPTAINTVNFGTLPSTKIIDAGGAGVSVIANLASPGSFTGAGNSTAISFSWGQCGTAASGYCKYAFARGLDASGNEVFELLFSQLNGAQTSQIYARGAGDAQTTRTATTTATPQGTLLINGFGSDTTFSVVGSAVNTTKPTGMIGVTVTLTNGQVTYAFSKGTASGNALTYAVNSAATTISKLEFSTISATDASGAMGYWLNNVLVTKVDAPTYTVTYDGNSPTSGTAPVDGSSPYPAAATVTVLGNTGGLAKTGFTFGGWNTQENGLGTTYSAGDPFSMPAANTTLYALWTTPASITATPSAFPAAVSTTYGTASTATSVAISGTSLSGDLTATAPTGLEVSANGTTFGSAATFPQSGGSASGTLYLRLANTTAAGSYNSQNVVLTTPGAAINVATTSSGNTVGALSLTIAGAAAQNKLYDGTTAAAITGTLTGVVNGDSITFNGVGTFASSAAGSGIAVTAACTLVGGPLTNNYTLTQPTGLTASIINSAIWANTAGGAWGTAGNWINNLIGSGKGTIADFSQIDMTSDVTVNLDTTWTVGKLIFGNTNVAPNANWTLANNSTPENILTLDGVVTPAVTVNALGTGKSATISAVMAGASGLVKAGSGTLILSATNTYTGLTTISNGLLQLSGGGSGIKSGNSVFVDTAGTLDLNGQNLTLGGLTGAGTTTNSGTGILTVGSGNVTSTDIGVISGSGSLTKTGTGTFTLGGANNYTGWTTNSGGGVLQLTNSSALGSSAGVFVANGSSLWLQGGITIGNVPIILNGGQSGSTGTFRSAGGGNNTYGGLVTLGAGSILGCSANTFTLSNPGIITGSGMNLTNFGNGNVTINSIIGTGTGGVVRLNGSGTLTLNGVNTYTGPTTVSANAGTLALGMSGSIANSTPITVDQGATFDVSAVTGGFTLGAAQTLKGKGTVTGAVVVKGTISPGASVGTLNTGSETWGPAGTYELEMSALSGVPGTAWDYLNIVGDLSITATNKVGGIPADGNKFNIKLVSASDLSAFNQDQGYSWRIARVTGSVNEFIVSKFKVDISASGLGSPSGTFSVRLTDKDVELVYTPSGCTVEAPTWTLDTTTDSPHTLMKMKFISYSGFASVQALVLENCSIWKAQQYALAAADDDTGGTPIGGTVTVNARTTVSGSPEKIVLWAKKTVDAPATVNAIAINTCGRGVSFDPILTTLEVLAGARVQQRFEGILSAEHYLHVLNGSPGLKRLEVKINDRVFAMDLTARQTVSSDLRQAMREGASNVVVITGYGSVGASAFVSLTDTLTGELQPVAEIVTLTLGQSAGGLTLAWPETLEGWQLQSSANADTGWADVATAPTLGAAHWTVTVAPSDGAQFYRLAGPTPTSPTSSNATPAGSDSALAVPTTNQPQHLEQTHDGILW